MVAAFDLGPVDGGSEYFIQNLTKPRQDYAKKVSVESSRETNADVVIKL